jgi:hypothetical protein
LNRSEVEEELIIGEWIVCVFLLQGGKTEFSHFHTHTTTLCLLFCFTHTDTIKLTLPSFRKTLPAIVCTRFNLFFAEGLVGSKLENYAAIYFQFIKI